MPTPRHPLLLTLVSLLALVVSCAPQAMPGLTTAEPVESSATPTALKSASEPTRKPPQQKSPQSFPTSSYDPVTSDFNVILGRPSAGSISASLLSSSTRTISIAYGTRSGNYTYQTSEISLQANIPRTIELSNLQPDTAYYYSLNGIEHTFHTARASGSTFTFTIDADPHNRDPRFNGELYAITLTNALADQPDFHINLGDTFMTEKLQPHTYNEAESTFTDMRPYFGLLGADAPLFLVNGNHEGELGWLLRGKNRDLPIWSTELRQLYYPGPTPNGFYTGSFTPDPDLGGVRDAYYAWTWGDALFIVLDPFWYTASKPQASDLNSNWNWTLGREQFDWLKSTLETSNVKYKFVFIHHLVGGSNTDARGGIESSPYFEWGGNNADGSYGFDARRPGWGVPIHQMLVKNQVSAVFHGHDHVFVKQDLDGIVYQELPQPNIDQPDTAKLAAEYGYVNGEEASGSGYLRVVVSPDQVTVDYVRSYLPQDENESQRNGQVDYSYTLK